MMKGSVFFSISLAIFVLLTYLFFEKLAIHLSTKLVVFIISTNFLFRYSQLVQDEQVSNTTFLLQFVLTP